MQVIKVDHCHIGPGQPVFVIAELSGNHGQSLEKAKEMILAAAEAGASAIKLQTYTPDTITLNVSHGEFFIQDQDNLWKGEAFTISIVRL